MKLRFVLAAAAALLLVAGAAVAQMVTRGMTGASAPLTGAETIPADTNLSSGRSPQTESVTVRLLQSERTATLTDAATITPNFSTATLAKVTLGGNRTMANPSANPPTDAWVGFYVAQDATGSRLLTWGTAYEWPAPGTAPTLITTGSAVDLIRCLFDNANTKYLCSLTGTSGFTP